MTPLVPPFIQHVIEQKAGPLAYVPTRAALGWRYLSYSWNPQTKQLTVRVHDKHYKLSNANHTVAVTAEYFNGTLATLRRRQREELPGRRQQGLELGRQPRLALRQGSERPDREDPRVGEAASLRSALAIIAASVKRILAARPVPWPDGPRPRRRDALGRAAVPHPSGVGVGGARRGVVRRDDERLDRRRVRCSKSACRSRRSSSRTR